MKTQTITILGLDRIGASIGQALRQAKLDVTVIGYDKERAISRQAKEAGAIDKEQWNLINAAATADILILSLAAVDLPHTMQLIGRELQPHTLILDLTPLKKPGLTLAEKYLQQGHYVGAAPVLAANAFSDGRTGIEAARPDLFKESIICLMPAAQAEPKAVETAVNLGLVLGAKPFFMDVAEYDSLMQGLETMPGLLAAALFRSLTQSAGWRDMLRFAGQSFALTTLPLDQADVPLRALHDKNATLRWLDALIEEMRQVRGWVAQGNGEILAAMFEEMGNERAVWLHQRAKNDWLEHDPPPVERTSLAEQLLGGLARQPKEKKKS
jgi:prephenate dehydrogenase